MIKLELEYKKSTPGTHVYVNTTDGAAIPTLYIKKPALPGDPPPSKITVMVE